MSEVKFRMRRPAAYISVVFGAASVFFFAVAAMTKGPQVSLLVAALIVLLQAAVVTAGYFTLRHVLLTRLKRETPR